VGLTRTALAYIFYTFLALSGIVVQTPFFENRTEVLVLAVSLTLSSSTVVREFLHRHILLETAFGRAIVEIMAMQDLVIAPIAALPSLLDHFLTEWQGEELDQILFFQTSFLYALFLMACLGLAKYIWPTLMGAMLKLKPQGHHRNRSFNVGYTEELSVPPPELFTLAVVSYCLAISLLFEHLQMSLEVGAIAAGLLMSYTPYATQAESTLEPLTSLFGGIYLASLGMIINPLYLLGHFWQILAWCLVVIAVKFTTGFVAMRRLGFTSIASYTAGFSLGQVSEVSLFFMAKSQHLGLVSRHTYLMAVATTVILMGLSPFTSHAMRHVTDKDLEFTISGHQTPLFSRHNSKRTVFWANPPAGKTDSEVVRADTWSDDENPEEHRRRRRINSMSSI